MIGIPLRPKSPVKPSLVVLPFSTIVNSTNEEIKSSLEKLALTVKMIHIDKKFPKIKQTEGVKACIFCPLKGGKHPMCNNSETQYKTFLKEHKQKKSQV